MNRWIQTDPAWAYDDMAIEGDKIEEWGCFLTAIANVIKTDPKSLNEIFRTNGVYQGKGFPMEESEIDCTKMRQILHISVKKITIVEAIAYQGDNLIVCIRDRLSPSGKHYCNVLYTNDRYITYWDVYKGGEKVAKNTDIIGLYLISK